MAVSGRLTSETDPVTNLILYSNSYSLLEKLIARIVLLTDRLGRMITVQYNDYPPTPRDADGPRSPVDRGIPIAVSTLTPQSSVFHLRCFPIMELFAYSIE